MKRHMNFFVKVEPNKQVSFDSIENAEIFMLDMWNRGDIGVTLYQIDPNYKETDELAPGYASVLTLHSQERYKQLIDDLNAYLYIRHSLSDSKARVARSWARGDIKLIRRYRELGGKV